MTDTPRSTNTPFPSHNNIVKEDKKWMRIALIAARETAAKGEVPVGAVLVKENKLISRGGNSPIGLHDPTAHAEIVVIRAGASILNNYRLPGTTLYVTLEPCIMCVGAMLHARINRLVYGTPDPKSGAISSVYNIGTDGLLNHNIKITGPVLENECSSVLKNFFSKKRKALKCIKEEKI